MKVKKRFRWRVVVFVTMAIVIAVGWSLGGVLTASRPAEFKVTKLVISPNPAQVEAPITVTVDVINSGAAEGTYSATLKIDGQKPEWGSQEVTLPAGRATRVSFPAFRMTKEGSFKIEVDGLTDTLNVTAAEATPPE